jgi:hypothetical protein
MHATGVLSRHLLNRTLAFIEHNSTTGRGVPVNEAEAVRL